MAIILEFSSGKNIRVRLSSVISVKAGQVPLSENGSAVPGLPDPNCAEFPGRLPTPTPSLPPKVGDKVEVLGPLPPPVLGGVGLRSGGC